MVDLHEWVGEEHLDDQMAAAIALCAHRLGTDRLKVGALSGAEAAARAGVRGAPARALPWEIGARAIAIRGDRGELALWLAQAAEHLDPSEIAHIQALIEDEDPHEEDQS